MIVKIRGTAFKKIMCVVSSRSSSSTSILDKPRVLRMICCFEDKTDGNGSLLLDAGGVLAQWMS